MSKKKTKLNITIDPKLKEQAQAVLENQGRRFSPVISEYLRRIVNRQEPVSSNREFVTVINLVKYGTAGIMIDRELHVFSNDGLAQKWLMRYFKDQSPEVDCDSQGRIVIATTYYPDKNPLTGTRPMKESVTLSYEPVVSKLDKLGDVDDE